MNASPNVPRGAPMGGPPSGPRPPMGGPPSAPANSSGVGAFFNKYSQSATNTVSKYTNSYKGMDLPAQIGILLVVIILVLVVAYLVIVYYSYSVNGLAVTPNDKLIEISELETNVVENIDNDKDHNFAIAFWLYTKGGTSKVGDSPKSNILLRATKDATINKTINLNKDIFGTNYQDTMNNMTVNNSNMFKDGETVVTADQSIVIMLRENDLIFAFKSANGNDTFALLGIDFLPLTLWNHVVLSVDGEHIVIYLNGELYKAINVSMFKSKSANGNFTHVDTAFSYMVLGNNKDNEELKNTFVTKLMYVDKEIGIKQVQRLYGESPYGSGLMASLGIGFQSPVYFIKYKE